MRDYTRASRSASAHDSGGSTIEAASSGGIFDRFVVPLLLHFLEDPHQVDGLSVPPLVVVKDVPRVIRGGYILDSEREVDLLPAAPTPTP